MNTNKKCLAPRAVRNNREDVGGVHVLCRFRLE